MKKNIIYPNVSLQEWKDRYPWFQEEISLTIEERTCIHCGHIHVPEIPYYQDSGPVTDFDPFDFVETSHPIDSSGTTAYFVGVRSKSCCSEDIYISHGFLIT